MTYSQHQCQTFAGPVTGVGGFGANNLALLHSAKMAC